MWQVFLDPPGGMDKINGKIIMFLDACCYGQNVRIEYNVLCRKFCFINKEMICSFANLDFSIE